MKCILLAGGAGERLWPVSREMYPKSLLKLYGNKTLFQNVYEIARSLTTEKNIITITNIRQQSDINIQLREIGASCTVLSEPMSKNTAPAIASALTYISSKRDETVLILPVDFAVKNIDKFKNSVEQAKGLVKQGLISAIAVKSDILDDGYGYIKGGDKIKDGYKAVKFTEKPAENEVLKNIKDKNYFVNCGIYMAKASVLLKAFEKYAPHIMSYMTKDMFDENLKIKYEYYENLPCISIDYAIMEKTDNLAFTLLDTPWIDYGSWKAIYNNGVKDNKNNLVHGNVILDKVKNSFVYSSKELVAVSGMDNTVVIETEDAVLVCNKDKTKYIKNIVSELKKKKSEKALIHKTVFRPWGFYTCLNEGKGWLTKIISVSPGHKLSLQSHNHRSEHWVVLEGNATVILENEKYSLKKRQSIDIPVKSKHSLQNLSKEPLKILEVQKGKYISEDDIIRYEDMYGRINKK